VEKDQSMIARVLKQRVGSDSSDAWIAEGAFLIAACVFPALITFWLLTMQLTPWQWVISMVATAALGFQLLVLSLLTRVLLRKKIWPEKRT
jgi:cobalamin biosynthesis protein CobD/CbiB